MDCTRAVWLRDVHFHLLSNPRQSLPPYGHLGAFEEVLELEPTYRKDLLIPQLERS